jgi:hypothetical protein
MDCLLLLVDLIDHCCGEAVMQMQLDGIPFSEVRRRTNRLPSPARKQPPMTAEVTSRDDFGLMGHASASVIDTSMHQLGK